MMVKLSLVSGMRKDVYLAVANPQRKSLGSGASVMMPNSLYVDLVKLRKQL
jgi:hypothetical protein